MYVLLITNPSAIFVTFKMDHLPVPAKVWRVGYKMQNTMTRNESKKMAKYIGMDPTSNEYRERVLAGARAYGEEAVAIAKKDLETVAAWYSMQSCCRTHFSGRHSTLSPIFY